MGRFTLYDDEEIVGHAQWRAWCDGWCGGSRRRAVQAFLFHDFWCQVAIAALVAVIAGIARGEVCAEVVTDEQ